jgi:hypothetical protein
LSHGHILVFQLATKMGYRSSTIVDINGPWLQLYMGCMSFKTLLEAGLYLNVNIIRVSLGSMRAFNHCYCLKLTTEWSNKNWAASASHLCAVYTHTHTHTQGIISATCTDKLEENGTKQNAAVPMGSTCLWLLLLILRTNLISNIACIHVCTLYVPCTYTCTHTIACSPSQEREASPNRKR